MGQPLKREVSRHPEGEPLKKISFRNNAAQYNNLAPLDPNVQPSLVREDIEYFISSYNVKH